MVSSLNIQSADNLIQYNSENIYGLCSNVHMQGWMPDGNS